MQVEIVLDSVNPYTGQRLTTFSLSYPQYIHNHILTHRAFSRNSSSYRAMSTGRVIKEDLVYPIWTKEKRGMQGQPLDLINPTEYAICLEADLIVQELYEKTLKAVEHLQTLGMHHQNTNEYLRPFNNIYTLITATDFENFFTLRCSNQAKPEIEALARAMRVEYSMSVPIQRYVHLPFIEVDEKEDLTLTDANLTSAARCARISYQSKGFSLEQDLELGRRLYEDKHLSPFEHSAFARKDFVNYANFYTWQSYRNYKGN